MILTSILQPISLGGFIPFIDKVMIGKDVVIPSHNVPAFILDLVAKINSMPRVRLLGIFIAF